eukprot:1550990-Pyramimonas_sp.AAC.1
MRSDPAYDMLYQYLSILTVDLSKTLKKSARKYWDRVTKRRVRDLNDAAKQINGYLAQRTARLIAGSRRGPRRRKFAAIPTPSAPAK